MVRGSNTSGSDVHDRGTRSVATKANEAALPRVERNHIMTTQRPPWPADDELRLGNIIGPETWVRCARFLSDPKARCYELSHRVSNTMPMSPYSKPLTFTTRPTRGMRHSIHSSNMDQMAGEPGGQGTHIDALGHFGYV